MDRIERVLSVMEGRRPDRPPVSFWHHFPPDQVCGRAAVTAHLDHVEAFDLDFLKIMNDNGYPHDAPIRSVGELGALRVLRGDEPPFARQLDLIDALKRRLDGRMLMTTTVFNAWATLRRLVKGAPKVHSPPNMGTADPASATILGFHRQDSAAVRAALGAIGTSLANFARRCLDAGADGIYMSVRDDWLDANPDDGGRYNDLVRPSDLEILAAASAGLFNVLHICGNATDFRAFAGYPVHVINWADRAAGPAIRDVRDWVEPAICAGIDNLTTLPKGTPDDCGREAADALAQAGDRPIMIAPGCTYDPAKVPRVNLEAICRAARR
ncbi:MAG: uroporphyrinogen decarboxylase family protein [Phycisphaerae bacterium]